MSLWIAKQLLITQRSFWTLYIQLYQTKFFDPFSTWAHYTESYALKSDALNTKNDTIILHYPFPIENKIKCWVLFLHFLPPSKSSIAWTKHFQGSRWITKILYSSRSSIWNINIWEYQKKIFKIFGDPHAPTVRRGTKKSEKIWKKSDWTRRKN